MAESIDRNRLYTDLMYRFQYVSKFVGFGEKDIDCIHSSAKHLAPLVPTIVDEVYQKLFLFNITKNIFAKRMEGLDTNEISSTNLHLDSTQMKFRKDMLSQYIVKLVTSEYDETFVKYLDSVALIHTNNASKRSKIHVEYIHINALMSFVETILIGTISDLPLDAFSKKQTLIAFNKLMWIQNDLFTQYYVGDGMDLADSRSNQMKVEPSVSGAQPSCLCMMMRSLSCKQKGIIGLSVAHLCVAVVVGFIVKKRGFRGA